MYAGQRILRREDIALIQGQARFLDDIKVDDTLHVGFVRSQYPHANILSIECDAAKIRPGVVGVITYDDIKGRMVEPILPRESTWIKQHRLGCLANKKVRYVGEPVVAILANDIYTAEDAIEDVEVEYQRLNPITDSRHAIDRNSEILNSDWEGNVVGNIRYSSSDLEEHFGMADLVVEREFAIQRHSASPIETRGCMAEFQPANSTLTVWSNTHLQQTLRSVLSACLGLSENNVKIISPNIGGSYGSKSAPYPEDILIPLLSILFRKRVKWVETRSENFASASHGREQTHEVKAAFRKNGKILAIRDKITIDLGAYPTGSGPNEALIAASYVTGCYDVKNYEFEIVATVTNKSPLGPYRGFGKSAPNFVIERVMDIAASKLGLDPLDIRAQNFVKLFPYTNAAGAVYDVGDYLGSLKRAADLIHYKEFRAKQREMRTRGEYIGIGFSSSIDPTGGAVSGSLHSPYDGVTVRITRSGKVNVYTGACGMIGTGHETSYSQIVADNLGAKLEDVRITEGDTDSSPVGLGSFSDRGAVYTVSAAALACRDLKRKILEIASLLLDESSNELEVYQSVVGPIDRNGNEKKVTLFDVAKMAYITPYLLPENIEPGLEATRYFTIRNIKFWPHGMKVDYFPCHGNSTHAAVVKVDKESGKTTVLQYLVVHNSGKVINPLIVEGQLHGGVAAGVGGVIFECVSYDSEGQLVTSSFMDYLIPTACEAPDVHVEHFELPSKNTILGTMGCGESGAIGSYGAIGNAINDALGCFDVEVNRLPINHQAIWQLLS